jgi:DNA-binding NarL/FixJ family response regulator
MGSQGGDFRHTEPVTRTERFARDRLFLFGNYGQSAGDIGVIRTTAKLRILVADDHALFRRGLVDMLRSETDWDVVASAANGQEAVDKALKARPDVAILDLSMPELNGLTAAQEIMKAVPRAQIILLTVQYSQHVLREALEYGVRGYVLKSDAERELISAIEAVAAQRPFFTSAVADMVLRGYLHGGAPEDSKLGFVRLTIREQKVIQLLAEGKGNKEVAANLHISPKTVQSHRVNISNKLGLKSVSDLVRYAIRNGMVTP